MLFKRYIYATFVAVLGLITALAFSEILLRIYYFFGENQLLGLKPSRTTIRWIEHPRISKVLFEPKSKGWFVTPSKEYYNFININSQGFNDTEHTLNKPEGVYRILFLGDSFVASVQTPLQQTFFKQTEESLRRTFSDKNIEVIALGMGDTGTAQQLLALKEIGLKYKPDLVVQMFLTANDLKNNYPNLQKDPYRPYFTASQSGELILLPHARYSQRKYSQLKDAIKNLRLVELFLQTRQTYLELKINKSVDYPVDYHVYDLNYNEDYQKAWGLTQKLILETKKSVEKSGGKYILVTLANNEQVNKNVWEKLKKNYPNLAKANLDLEKPDKMILQFCLDNKVSCSQMLPNFKEYVSKNPSTPTHYHLDGHWNRIGTSVATNYLISIISSQLIHNN